MFDRVVMLQRDPFDAELPLGAGWGWRVLWHTDALLDSGLEVKRGLGHGQLHW